MDRVKKIIVSVGVLRNMALFFLKIKLRVKGNKIGPSAKVGFSVICEGKNSFGSNSSLFGSHLGYATYIGSNSHFSKTKIGRYCSIGQNVNCIFGKHPTEDFVSTHPAFFSTDHSIGFTYVNRNLFVEHAGLRDEENKYSIVIGNDVWIANNVSIMEGIVIGNGAIIAANALVTKDVPPYAIVGGVPAKVIKKRFSEEEIQFLLNLKWWDKPESWVKEHAKFFADIKQLKNYVNET